MKSLAQMFPVSGALFFCFFWVVVLDDSAALRFKLLTSAGGVTQTGRGFEKVVVHQFSISETRRRDYFQPKFVILNWTNTNFCPTQLNGPSHILDAATKEMMQELPVLNPPAGIKGSCIKEVFLIKMRYPDGYIYHSTTWDMLSVDDNTTLGNDAGN
ncbi:hypothetical protein B0H19DRAFT_1073817 [Mycena capillaripes]|nr:hypothetical protein B0H19DRAFT_1073817 [Mycena capillaripes]